MYSNMEKEAREKTRAKGMSAIEDTIKDMLNECKTDDQVINIFKSLDTDGSGCLEFDEFAKGYQEINPNVSMVQLKAMFKEADLDGNGTVDLYEVSFQLMVLDHLDLLAFLILNYIQHFSSFKW